MSTIERYVAPASLAEAAELLREGNVTVVAGSTDLTPQTRSGRVRFQPVLMNIRRIPGLAGIAEEEGFIRIGALTTISGLLASQLVRERLHILWQACDHFASDQIRNAATLGGNLCNASPAGDTLVPLLVLDARAVLASKPNGALESRSVPLTEFFTGPGKTLRRPTELLQGIEIPVPKAGFFGAFDKFGARPALDISTISIGLGAVIDGRKLRDVRIALGAVAPTPIRVPKAEALLEGRVLDEQAVDGALGAVDRSINPITDVRASDWYRRELVRNTLRRMLSHAAQG
jgi:xanthine dehydrogenase FAD-binding subunit